MVFNFKNWPQALEIYIVLIAVGGISIGVSLFTDLGMCLWRIFTGLPCFSCGMGRAVVSLPNIGQAFRYHPLFFILPVVPFLPILNTKLRNVLTVVLIVALVGVYGVRMFLFFPHTVPMEFSEQSLAQVILNWLR